MNTLIYSAAQLITCQTLPFSPISLTCAYIKNLVLYTYSSFEEWDGNFSKRFEEYMGKSWQNNGQIDLNDFIVHHNVYMLELHRLILKYLHQEDVKKVSEIFKLLVLSHALKGVPFSEFRVINQDLSLCLTSSYRLWLS